MTDFNNDFIFIPSKLDDNDLEHLEWYLDIGLTRFQALRTQLQGISEENGERKKEVLDKLEELGTELKGINKRLEELRKKTNIL